MKKRLFNIMAVIAIIFVGISCSSKSEKANDPIADRKIEFVSENEPTGTIADSVTQANAIIDFITDFYNNRKFEDETFLEQHCSERLLKKLRNDYEYEGGGLATWDFRSDAQDGPNERHEIISIEPQGDNWYLYKFYDMGIKGSHEICVIQNDEDYVIDELK